jgi:hypothetical protein
VCFAHPRSMTKREPVSDQVFKLWICVNVTQPIPDENRARRPHKIRANLSATNWQPEDGNDPDPSIQVRLSGLITQGESVSLLGERYLYPFRCRSHHPLTPSFGSPSTLSVAANPAEPPPARPAPEHPRTTHAAAPPQRRPHSHRSPLLYH